LVSNKMREIASRDYDENEWNQLRQPRFQIRI
jgi:hypothetical protein